MRFRALSRALVMSIWLVILPLGTVSAAARDGRDFAGMYGFTDVQEHGDVVTLTLHLQLFNDGDADIKAPVITLMEGPAGIGLRGSFPSVKVWRKNQGVKVSQQFTIPKREYEEWLRPPAQPNVVIIYQDANGKLWEKGAQMRPQPVV